MTKTKMTPTKTLGELAAEKINEEVLPLVPLTFTGLNMIAKIINDLHEQWEIDQAAPDVGGPHDAPELLHAQEKAETVSRDEVFAFIDQLIRDAKADDTLDVRLFNTGYKTALNSLRMLLHKDSPAELQHGEQPRTRQKFDLLARQPKGD